MDSHIFLQKNKRDMQYTLIRSSRRTLALQIDTQSRIIVRAPKKYPLEKIEEFIKNKSSWIEKHQTRMKIMISQNQWKEEYYSIFWEEYLRGDIPDSHIVTIQKEALRKYLHIRIPEIIEGKALRKNIEKIHISSAKTRWGSCSSRGTLSFSYRLISFPKETIDAVIIHEIAHLNHPNHSKYFWNLVYAWLPEYDIHTKALKNHIL
jgi:predicted metal-dependent hydrolase